MKPTILSLTILFSLAGPTSALAQQQAGAEIATETGAPGSETPSSVAPDASPPMAGMGKKHRGTCYHGKGRGGMQHRAGHGKGHHDKDHQHKHAQVVKRLDMIEARLTKIEAMLETLMRR